jgi:tRNA(Ile)-lysidine synthase TilS/MesJ
LYHVITRYAYFKKLDYFSTECIYSPDAYRGHARAFLKDLEAARPSAIIDIIHSGEAFEIKEEIKATQKVQRKCSTSLLRRKGLLSYLIFYLQKLARDVGTCPAMNCVKLARYWRDLNGEWQIPGS